MDYGHIRFSVIDHKSQPQIVSSLEVLPTGTLGNSEPLFDRDIQDVVRSWVRENRLIGCQSILGLPTGMCINRPLMMPPLKRRAMRLAVGAELINQLHVPFDNPVFDYTEIVTSESTKCQLIVFAADQYKVARLQAEISKCGLYPVAVEPRVVALYRLLKTQELTSSTDFQDILLVDVQMSWVEMSVFVGGYLLSSRSVSIRLQDYLDETRASSENAIAAFSQELTLEVNRYLDFLRFNVDIFQKQPSDSVVIVSLGDRVQIMAEVMEPRVDIAVCGLDLRQLVNNLRSPSDVMEAFPIATGLGLRKGRIKWT